MKNLIYVALLATLFISCKKEAGPQGPAGTNGTNGNANVKTNQYTVSWTQSFPGYYCTIYDANITQAIVDSGAVEVYMQNSPGWNALPLTITYTATITSVYTPVHYLGQVTIWKFDTDDAQTTDDGPTTFKVVCIAGGIQQLHPNVNWNKYEDVRTTFNLSD